MCIFVRDKDTSCNADSVEHNMINHVDLILLFESSFDEFKTKLIEIKETVSEKQFSQLLSGDDNSGEFYDNNRIWFSPMLMWVLWAVGDHFEINQERIEWMACLPTGNITGITAEEGFDLFKFLVDNGASFREKNYYDDTTISLINNISSERVKSCTSRCGEEYDAFIRLIHEEYPETRLTAQPAPLDSDE